MSSSSSGVGFGFLETVKGDLDPGIEPFIAGEVKGETTVVSSGGVAPGDPELQGDSKFKVSLGPTSVTAVVLAAVFAKMRVETAEAGLVFAARDLVVLRRVVLRKLSSSSLELISFSSELFL